MRLPVRHSQSHAGLCDFCYFVGVWIGNGSNPEHVRAGVSSLVVGVTHGISVCDNNPVRNCTRTLISVAQKVIIAQITQGSHSIPSLIG